MASNGSCLPNGYSSPRPPHTRSQDCKNRLWCHPVPDKLTLLISLSPCRTPLSLYLSSTPWKATEHVQRCCQFLVECGRGRAVSQKKRGKYLTHQRRGKARLCF